jgi:hypothetical protein
MFRWSAQAAPFVKFIDAFNILMAAEEKEAKTNTTPVFVKSFTAARNAQTVLTEIVRSQNTAEDGRRAIREFLDNAGEK